MVVENLTALVNCEFAKVNHHMAFPEQRKRRLPQSVSGPIVNVIAGSHHDFRAVQKRGFSLGKNMVPAQCQTHLILSGPESVVNPEQLRRFLRVPVFYHSARLVQFEDQCLPAVDGGNSQHCRYGGLARSWFPKEKDKPMPLECPCRLFV